jgi:flagellar biosynthetic protein FlhB
LSEDSDADGKTEDATEKRLQDAIEQGNVPVSCEIAFVASLAAYLVAVMFVFPAVTPDLAVTLMHFIDDPAGWRLERASDVAELASIVALAGARFLGPAILLMMALGVGGTVLQNAPRVTLTRVMPDLSRLSIMAGASRLFGPRGWTEFLKSILKLGAVGVVVALLFSGQRFLLVSSMFVDIALLPGRLLSLVGQTITAVLLAVSVIAGADFAWTRIHWRRDLRMSRQELKEEVKQAEGDRMVKARLRSLRLDRSRKRMMKAVPRATLVLVNPTHYAVALRYVRSEGGAPLVLAKGVDLIALKIREIALENDIPIVEDRPLARSLHDAWRSTASFLLNSTAPSPRSSICFRTSAARGPYRERGFTDDDRLRRARPRGPRAHPGGCDRRRRHRTQAGRSHRVHSHDPRRSGREYHRSRQFVERAVLQGRRPQIRLGGGLRTALGIDSDRLPRHGVPSRVRDRVLPLDDRSGARGGGGDRIAFRGRGAPGRPRRARAVRRRDRPRAVDVRPRPRRPLGGSEGRSAPRARTRLRSAKILDGASAFVCEALIQDRSPRGMRLLLARHVGLSARFAVHDDATGEIVTVAAVWRRERAIGVRVLAPGPISPLGRSDRIALAGLYFGVRNE